MKKLILVAFILQLMQVNSQVVAEKADAFVNSIGINTHLTYDDGVYKDGTNTKNQLLNLGIKHIRDGLDTDFNTALLLSQNNIKITGFLQGDFNIANQTPQFWIQRVKNAGAISAFEAFEGPNEADLSIMNFTYKGLAWPLGVKYFQMDLYEAVKNDPAINNIPVLGPTIGNGFKSNFANDMGDISAYVDYGNFHYYKTFGQSYSEGSPDWNLQNIINQHNVMFGSKPYMSTEGGYSTAIQEDPGISESLDAKYTLRYYLEYWRLGVARTFKYELFDQGVSDTNIEDKFGLIKSDGTTLKPSGLAVKNIISILTDPQPTSNFQPETLNFAINNADNYTHYNLLQKSNGTFYLVVWNDAPSWNDDTKSEISNSDQVSIIFNEPIADVKLYAPCTNGNSILSTFTNPNSINVRIPNNPYIYEITKLNSNLKPSTVSSDNGRLSIYPNPANTEIILSGEFPKNANYEILSVGQKILSNGVLNGNTINIENFKSGIYILKINSGTSEKTCRFIKK